MFKYDGYIIVTEPDYEEAISRGEGIEELHCEVYAESDTELTNCLNDFNMMIAFEFKEATVSEIENGIMNMINEDSVYLELCVKQKQFDRQSEILNKALDYIGELQRGSELYSTLREQLGMSNEEIVNYGFRALDRFFDQDEELETENELSM